MFERLYRRLEENAGPPLALAEGTQLFRRGDPVRFVFVLERGRIKLARTLLDGKELILHHAVPGNLVAESAIYAATYHCDAICTGPAQFLSLSTARFRAILRAEPELADAWSAHLARSLQGARHRCEILTMKTVAEKLDAWLDWQGGALPAKGAWKDLAAEIAVSPEALYRELARRRSGTAPRPD